MKRSSSVTWHKIKYLCLREQEESQWVEDLGEKIQSQELLINIDENSIDARLELAKLMRQKRDFDESNCNYHDLLNRDPQNVNALNGLGWNYLLLHKTVKASEYFMKAHTINPENTTVLVNLVWSYLLQNDTANTKKYAEKLTKQKPDISDAWVQLGWAERFFNKENVETCCKKALQLNNKNICALEDLGNYFSDQRDYKKACHYYGELSQLTPGVPDAWSYLGEMQIRIGKIEKAITSYKRAHKLDEKNFCAMETLVFLYGLQADYSQSAKFIRLLDEFEPDFYDGWIWLRYDKDQAQKEGRERILIHIHKHVPKSWYIFQTLGKITEDSGNFEKAIDYYKQLIELIPDYSDGWNHLCQAQAGNEKFEDAKKSAYKALELNDRNYDALKDLGETLLQKERFKEAMAIFQELIGMDSKNAPWWENLGSAQKALKQYRDAEQSYLKALELDEKRWNAMYNLGLICFNQENYSQAYKYVSKVIKMAPRLGKGWQLLSNILEARGNADEAKKCSEKAEKFKEKAGAFKILSVRVVVE